MMCMSSESSKGKNDSSIEWRTARKGEPGDASDAKRILILTADTGLGHRITAQAISEALQELYGEMCQVAIVNPMDDARTPDFLRDSQADYDKAVREMPDLYQLGYQMSDVPLAVAIIETGLTVMLSEVMKDVLNRYQPDVIVTTHQNYLAPLRAVFDMDKRHIPLFTVVTDLATVHQMWFNSVADLCMVSTDVVRDQALKYELPPEKIKVTGIPVSLKMAEKAAEPAILRAELGWQQDLKTVLVVGGKRVANLTDALRVLNHSALPLQLAIVAGGDDGLFQQLQETKWHLPAHIYNFVDNMATLLHASDCIICKAGGLIVTEALACGLPILLFGVIPGHETGNANYVVETGAGEMAQNPLEVLDIMSHWLQHEGELLSQRAQNARALGRPFAAQEVAQSVWAAAQHGPSGRSGRILKGLSRLNSWLGQLDALWKREFGLDKSQPAPHLREEKN
jgi:1,2-diacylglycerol 3-beta-galactosyltransferase